MFGREFWIGREFRFWGGRRIVWGERFVFKVGFDCIFFFVKEEIKFIFFGSYR